ncbi:MAG: hypothetical protein ABI488_17950 [Polyangiaceae bacterium]
MYRQSTPPLGSFSAVSVGNGFSCGIHKGGELECWGVDSLYAGPDTGTLPSGSFVALSTGGGTDGYAYNCACGLKTDGSIACWGDCTKTPPAPASFTQVSVGAGHVCALDTKAREWCWGAVARQPL